MKMTDEDWKKFDAMTQEDVEAAIASDSDSQVLDSKEFFASGKWVEPKDGVVVLPISVDIKIANFINEHHLDYQGFIAGVLKTYVENQK
jgi:hypothetical protein